MSRTCIIIIFAKSLANGDNVAKRINGGHRTYTLEGKHEVERLIPNRVYVELLKLRSSEPKRKKIFSFVHEKEVLTVEQDKEDGKMYLTCYDDVPNFVKLKT